MNAIALNSTANAVNSSWNNAAKAGGDLYRTYHEVKMQKAKSKLAAAKDLVDDVFNSNAAEKAWENADPEAKRKGGNMVVYTVCGVLAALALVAGGVGCHQMIKWDRRN